MRRAVVAAAVAILALARPVGAQTVPDVYESSAVASGLHVTVSVPAYFEVFGPYAFAESSNGASHSYQAPGYAGFFLTAAAEQFGFPPPPGTTETLYPQGPREASTGTPVLASSGRSGPEGAEGEATVGRGGQAPYFVAGGGHAESSVEAAADGVRSRSHVNLQDLSLADGLVTIEQVVGTATALASGVAGRGRADAELTMAGVRVAGVAVDLDADSVSLAGTPFGAPSTVALDDFLSLFGIAVERLPTTERVTPDGDAAETRIGGVRFTFTQPGAEFEATVTIGDLVARSRVADLAGAPPQPGVVGNGIGTGADGSLASPGDAVAPDEPIPVVPQAMASERVVRTVPVRGADWIALAALAALAGPLLLVIRRAFRAAVRP